VSVPYFHKVIKQLPLPLHKLTTIFYAHNVLAYNFSEAAMMSNKVFKLAILIGMIFCGSIRSNNVHFIGTWPAGFFACFNCVLNHLDWCERNAMTPIVYWDERSWYYVPWGYNNSYNAWEYYFEPVASINYPPPFKIRLKFTPYVPDVIKFSVDHLYDYSRQEAFEIISKYIRIKPNIQEKIDHFYTHNIASRKTIGIHIRGTDKASEERPITPEKIIDAALQYADDDTQFLLATDEQWMLHRMIELLKGRTTVYYDCYRSDNGKPIQLRQPKPSKAQVGEDVLVEAMLLSKCDRLIHTLSNVSSVALYFNPTMPHTVVRQDGLPTEPPFHRESSYDQELD